MSWPKYYCVVEWIDMAACELKLHGPMRSKRVADEYAASLDNVTEVRPMHSRGEL